MPWNTLYYVSDISIYIYIIKFECRYTYTVGIMKTQFRKRSMWEKYIYTFDYDILDGNDHMHAGVNPIIYIVVNELQLASVIPIDHWSHD